MLQEENAVVNWSQLKGNVAEEKNYTKSQDFSY